MRKARETNTADFHEAYEEEVLPLTADLLARARVYTRGLNDAEDLVQETLLRAFIGWHTFTPGTSCRSWLLKILHNAFVSRYRRKKMETAWLNEPGSVMESLHSGSRDRTRSSPERKAAERVLRREVEAALAELPIEFRQVVELRCLKGSSYRSIARSLNIPVGTVMSRLHRGRKQLRARVERKLLSRTEERPSGCGDSLDGIVDCCLVAA